MVETVLLHDAPDYFARLLRDVADGHEVTISRDGEPVARVVAASSVQSAPKLTQAQEAALERTTRRLETGWPLGIGKFDRDELYATARPWIERYLKD